MTDCQHRQLGDLRIVRCAKHSAENVATWAWWSTPPEDTGQCPCEVANRYVVAGEHAPPNWVGCADVLLADPRATVREAIRAARRLRRGVVVVPVPGWGTLFYTDSAWRDPERCAVCVYPVLVTAGAREPRRVRVARRPRGGPRSRRRDPEHA